MTLTKIIIVFGGIYLWSIGEFSVGEFVFILTAYNFISSYLRSIGKHTRNLFAAAGDMEDIIIFSKQDFEIQDKPKAKKLKVTQGKIELKNINFSYKKQLGNIFENLSLSIQPGEKIALIGHSGSGKSTFVKLIQRFYDIQSGNIAIDSQSIDNVTLESLRRETIIVAQEPILFHRSLADNIAYGNQKASLKEIKHAAKLAHADIFIDKLPDSYNTLVGERGVKLSGGERQRIAIARAILSNKKILILDEATAALDSESEKHVQDAMKQLLKDKTAIVIAHRLSTIKNVDRIIVFENGKIVEEGNHAQLLRKKGGTYKKFYTMQADGFIE